MSDTFTLTVENVPKHFTKKDFQKFLLSKLPEYFKNVTVSKKYSLRFGQVHADKESVDAAQLINAINALTVKGCTLEARLSGAKDDKKDSPPRNRPAKRVKVYEGEKWEHLNDKVTPLWRQPYEKQLEVKQNDIKKILKNYEKELKSLDVVLSRDDYLQDIVPCPEEGREGYRNKNEFSIGLETRDDENEVVVGFMLGMYKEGSVEVAPADKCVHICEVSKRIASWTQEFIQRRLKDGFSIYNRVDKTGFWRLLMVRISKRTKEALIFIQTNSHENQEALNSLRTDTLKLYAEKFSDLQDEIERYSVFWQTHEGVHNGIVAENIELLHGGEFIHEKLNLNGYEFTFRVSPMSFFQSNTPACEVLYNLIGKLVQEEDGKTEEKKEKIILDLCSGTGTIGISLSKIDGIKKIIGIEIIQDAVYDAIKNAELNGIAVGERLNYICDKVESALKSVLKELKSEDCDLIAILDPPRAGVAKEVIQAIRNCNIIKKLIYVSCNPKAALNNWLQITRPPSNNFPMQPFTLDLAQAVDMFPHTEHCELVLKFVRP
ncbi:hypothetical protein MP638_002279 [Amoeboaphelidium occidentale]|nr:hypothetical protein MP638_002279 [Amoeboaphelidium occidentale]